MTTIYSTPLEERLKEAQRRASRLETESEQLRQQLETVSRALTSTDNADRYFRGFNDGFNHAKREAWKWQPVGDGVYGDIFTRENQLAVPREDATGVNLVWSNPMADDIRLCRRVKEAEEEERDE